MPPNDQNGLQGSAPPDDPEWLLCAVQHKERLNLLSQEVNDMRNAISQIGTLHQKITDNSAKYDRLQSENEILRFQIGPLHQKVEKISANESRLQKEIDKISAHESRLQKEVEDTSTSNSRLQKTVKDLSASNSRLQSANETLQQQMANLEHENNQQDQINNLKSQAQHDCKDRVEDLSSKVEGLFRVAERIHNNTCVWRNEDLKELEELKAQMGSEQGRSGANAHSNRRLGDEEQTRNNNSRTLCC